MFAAEKKIIPNPHAGDILGWFRKNMNGASTELHYKNPFQLLVSVMLSAQCTDKRVNMVTPALFEKFPTPESLASSSFEEVLPYVSSVTFPNSKTRHLLEMSRRLVSDYKSEVPSEVPVLEKLPGCGRKTANVVASICFGANVIAVDTHVFRVSHRLGLSDGSTPLAVENDLNGIIPEKDRGKAHHWLILHGRYVCTARKPHCGECGLSKWCPSAFSL